MQIIKVPQNEINSFRLEYLNKLPEFQELYLELLVKDSDLFNIIIDDNTTGYAAKTNENILIEFYLKDNFISGCENIFKSVMEELSISKIYCKSFDFLLLNCCLVSNYPYKLIGSLYRDYFEKENFFKNELKIRIAEITDYEFLLQQKDGLYDSPEELEYFIKGKNILMFFKNEKLAGCGYLIKVHDEFKFYDIGMWVNPDFRKQGIATQIISYLKIFCIQNNWEPICGCAIENIASQNTLENNGFYSKHKLIEFIVK